LINFCKEKDIILNKPPEIANYRKEENLILGKEKEDLNK
jgi:hypothetical protein